MYLNFGIYAEERYIKESTIKEFTKCQLVFNHDNLTQNDITSMLHSSYKNYYSNPKWIFKYLISKIKTAFIH